MCDDDAIAEAAPIKSSLRLKEIARLLGKPDDIFNQKTGANEGSDTVELLQHWESLKSVADRQKLLNFARALKAGRE